MHRLAGHLPGIVPAYGNLVSGRAEVGGVLLRGALAIHVGEGHRLGQHILGIPDVGVGGDVQAVLEEAEVHAGVVGNHGLPGQAAGNGRGHRGALGRIGPVEGVCQLGQGDGVEIVIVADLLVAQGAVAQAELGFVPGVLDRRPERLLADAPAYGSGGEEAPAVILGEAGGSVIAPGNLEEVAFRVIIVEAPEETERPVGAVALVEGRDFRRGGQVDVGKRLAQRSFLVDRQVRRTVVVEVGAQRGGKVVPAERAVVGEVGVGYMSVLIVADLAIEVIYGPVAEITAGQSVAHVHALVGIVVAVGRGKAAVLVHVVVAAVGIVGDEFQALRDGEGQAVGQGEGVPDAGVMVGIGRPHAAAAAEERGSGAVHVARLDVHRAVGIERHVEGADVLRRIPQDTRLHQAGLSVLLPEAAVSVVVTLEGDIAGIVQPGGDFRVQLGAEREVVDLVLGALVEQALAVQVTSAHIIVHFLGAALDGNVVLRFGTAPLEQVSVPVEVAEIQIGIRARLVGNDPRPGGILGDVVPAVIHHLDLLLREGPGVVALEDLVEGVGHHDVVVGGGQEVRRGGVAGDGEAAVVVDGRLALLAGAALGVHQDHAGGSLCAVDGAGGGVLQHGNALDVIRVHHRQAALHAVDQDERAAGVEGNLSADGHAVFGSFDGTVPVRENDGRVRSLKGHGRVGDGALVQGGSVDDGHGAGQVHLLLEAVTHDDDFIEQVLRIAEDNPDVAFVAIDRHLLVRVADVGDDEGRRESDVRERETAVLPGDESERRALDADSGAHQGLSVLVHDHAGERRRPGLGLSLADRDAFAVDNVNDLLSGEDLVQHVVDR